MFKVLNKIKSHFILQKHSLFHFFSYFFFFQVLICWDSTFKKRPKYSKYKPLDEEDDEEEEDEKEESLFQNGVEMSNIHSNQQQQEDEEEEEIVRI